MESKDQVSRRSFIQKSAGAVAIAAPLVLPSRVLSGPNDTINVGVIGPGRRGQQIMKDLQNAKGGQIVALSDVNEERIEMLGNRKPWKLYTDFRKMLESKEVDAVLVATPDHWHALNSIYACMAGKDVYCEKPMTLTIQEGRVMVQAARKHKRIVQCGSQQRSMKACRIGIELVRQERVGKIKEVHGYRYASPWDQPFPEDTPPASLDWDMWLGPTPKRAYHDDIYTPRANPGWISIMPYSGGEVTGWGAHGVDIIQWGLDMEKSGPVEIWLGDNHRELDAPVHMKYANGVVLHMDGNAPEGGGVFVGEKGSITVDRGRFEVNPKSLGAVGPDAGNSLYVSNDHMQNWIDCIKSRELPIADVEIAHRSTSVCHLMNIARWTRRKLQWNPDKEQFVDDKDANTYIDRPRRSPWELPKIS
ncbi:MAG: Gfo/Idh/MocA family oxidoreductase [Candidatus Hinthialibacter antarcticus]|nr:Gfo/Idh/MocA family oxidoreductase [Candidatus Hinthialibacter antarcticus]